VKHRWVIRPAAEADIDDIALYIAKRNVEAGHRFLRHVFDDIEMLAANPGFGTRIPDSPLDLRRWRVKGFNAIAIIYRSTIGHVRVLRVLHGAQDWDRILERLTDGS